MPVYYNEIDKFCCDWLRELINRGLLPDGEIDSRSIEDVKPAELRGFSQCHFFAGIGGWPYALRLAGWPDERPVWTGSCHCQPFSIAGKRKGIADERHLWPAFFRLISQCRPDTIIGEQVASKDALAWWDIVHTDLEAEGYACGVCDTCAAGYGAPHIRQRLYWVGFTTGARLEILSQSERNQERWGKQIGYATSTSNESGWMENAASIGYSYAQSHKQGFGKGRTAPRRPIEYSSTGAIIGSTMPTNGFWANPDWLWCRDKKWRPVESGIAPLVDGFSKRMVRGGDFRAIKQRLHAYGNAIVIPQAVEFIKATMEVLDDTRGQSQTAYKENS